MTEEMGIRTIFSVCIFNLLVYTARVSTSSGPCYSGAQASCRDQWTKLVLAQKDRHNSNICRHFGAVHSCTLKYMSKCKFEKHEQELYQKDIVAVYTHKPYSCALIGGNLEYKAEYQGSGTSMASICILLFQSLLLIVFSFIY